jgi:hypothetical protein
MIQQSVHDVIARACALVYRPESANFCPGCSRSNWYVGRMVAECAFCGTALPLRDSALVTPPRRRLFIARAA